MATDNGKEGSLNFDNPGYEHGTSSKEDLYVKEENRSEAPSAKKRSGCFVSTRNALILLLCALAAAAIVGLLVYFLHPDKGKIEGSTVAPTVPSQASTTHSTTNVTSTNVPPVDVRLSGDVVPEIYELRLRPNIYGGDPSKFRFTGDVKISFNVQQQLKEITLNTKQLVVPKDKIDVRKVKDNSRIHVLDTRHDADTEFFHIYVEQTLQPGDMYTAYMEFSGNISDDLAGLYYSTYRDGNEKEEYLLTSQLQATDARKVFPCFDEPAIKAKFKVSMERKKGFMTMSNTEITSNASLANGWEVDHYSESPKMSTYLLAFIVSKFVCIEDKTARGTVVEICARPNAISHAEYALSVAVPLQEYYEWYFNIPYPLPKMTHAALPDFAYGAMENWGLVIYRETALLYDSKTTSASSKQWVTIVIAHELSHMWFGNLVTPSWWDDIWLNEGFASWMEITGTENITDNWQMERQFVVHDMQSVMRIDGLASSHPVYQPVYRRSEIVALFDAISYSKGASIIRMMQHFLGYDVFRLGLSNYLKDRSYQAAHHDQLFHALTKEAQMAGQTNLNVTEVMYTWIRQMGYPVVHVTYNKANGQVTLKQKHFLLDPSKKEAMPESPYGYIWAVPVTIYAKTPEAKMPAATSNYKIHWLKSDHEIINAAAAPSADWILANVKQQHYYRVNYDKDMWDALILQLTDDHTAIYIENRAQIIDDAFALGRAGEIDQLVGLRTTEYLDKEMEYVPWVAAVDNMAYLDSVLELSQSYNLLKKYMQQRTDPHHSRLGWKDDPNTDPHLEQRMRRLIIGQACLYGLESCVRSATAAFSRWMTDPVKNTVSANLQSVVFCNGIRYGGGAEWDFVYDKYKTSGSAEEQDTFLRALACTRQADLLNSYLQKALDLEIRRQDFRTVIVGVSRNANGRALAWNFLRANWDKIYNMFGAYLDRILKGLTDSFSTEWEKKELTSFKSSVPNLGIAALAFDQAIETVTINIGWRRVNEQKLTDWLKNKTALERGTTPASSVDIRLSGDVIAEHYDVMLRPDFYGIDPKKFSFSGTVTMLLNAKHTTNLVTLHYKLLTIDQSSITIKNRATYDVIKVSGTMYEKEKDFYHIMLEDSLAPGEGYEVSMSFTGPLTNDLHGLYLSSYHDSNGTTQYLVTSQLQATDARKVFPCLDEPALKATFTITIERKDGYKSFGNTDIFSTKDLGGGWWSDLFMPTPKMSTYLLAFVVSKFKCKSSNSSTGTKIELCARPEVIDQVDYAQTFAGEMQVYFEEYFNIPFPLAKMGHVAVPDFAAGAMENWGLILYREYALLYDPQSTDVRYKQYLTYVVAHELAHQWFGNLVTPQWWDDIWLNEGFASWMMIMCTDNSFPEWKMEAQFIISDVQRVMALDGLVSSHPIYQPVNDPAEIGAIFDAITYSKRYLRDRSYGAAYHNDLFATLTEVAKEYGRTNLNVTKIMYTWIRQMGYPVIHASYDNRTGKVTLDQKHFLLDPSKEGEKPSSPYDYLWEVPMTMVTDLHSVNEWTGMTPEWFSTATGQEWTKKAASWIVLNPGVTYYYRTQYDDAMWNALIEQLQSNHEKIVKQENRAQLIDDSFNLGRSGEIDQLVGLRMTEYLDKEMEYVPWYSAIKNFGYVNDMLELSSSYSYLKKYMQLKIGPHHARLGWNDDVRNDPHLEQRMRYTLLGAACFYGLPSCVVQSTKQFSLWMQDPVRNKVSPNLQQVVYCNGVRYGGAPEWDFVLPQYKVAASAAQAAIFISSMACSKQPDLLNSYLQQALDEEIRRGDFSAVISGVANNPTGRFLAWNFLRANWDAIYDKYGQSTFAFGNIISGVTASFSTQFELDEVLSLKSSVPNLGSAVFAFDQAIEKVANNIAWRATNEQKVSEWLKENTKDLGIGDKIDVRLPKTLIPVDYMVRIRPNIYTGNPETFGFNGTARVTLQVLEATDRITLHSRSLKIQDEDWSVKDSSMNNIPIKSIQYDKAREFYVLTLRTPLGKGKTYSVHVTYTGPVDDTLLGLYWSSYQDGNDLEYLVASQLQATHARKVFPCFDEPGIKARFNITIEYRKEDGFTTKGNTDIYKTEPLEDGWWADHYTTTPEMSTYLLGFLVSKFDCLQSTTKNGVTVEVCARPNGIEQAKFANNFANNMQEYYVDAFKIPFPLPRLSHIALPDFAFNGMENWGIIMYREARILNDQGSGTAPERQYAAVIIAHELAHQWFGNLVTPDWWDDLWLNEGFATWVAVACASSSFPDMQLEEQFVIERLQPVLRLDGLVKSHPVYQEVNDPGEIDGLFDAITYSKGASVNRMMQYFLGDDAFKAGLTAYLTEQSYKAAFHDQLFGTLTRVAINDFGMTINVTAVMNTWIRQIGYPVVNVDYDSGTGVVTLKQKHFLLDPSKEGDKPDSPYGYVWEVPFTCVTDVDSNYEWTNPRISWFNTPAINKTCSANGNWIIGNVGQRMYYRVNYLAENWNRLIDVLNINPENIKSIANRAQVIDDSFNLGRAGELDQLVAMRVTEYLDKEMEFVPWQAAVDNLDYVNDMFQLSSSYGHLKKYMQMKTANHHDRLGWTSMNNAAHTQQLLRGVMIGTACSYGVETCLQNAKRLFNQWMVDVQEGRPNPIHSDVRFAAYCYGLSSAGATEWEFVLAKYKTADSAGAANTLLRSLSCTSQAYLLNSLLERALSAEIRLQDFNTVIVAVSKNAVGRSLAWNFFRANWNEIRLKFGDSPFILGRIVTGITAKFSTEWELQELRDFKNSIPDAGSAVFAFEQAIESTSINIAWRKKNEQLITDWLKEKI